MAEQVIADDGRQCFEQGVGNETGSTLSVPFRRWQRNRVCRSIRFRGLIPTRCSGRELVSGRIVSGRIVSGRIKGPRIHV
jgi:hypothetical protein